MANNKLEAPPILTLHKPSMHRHHMLPTAFEEEEDLFDKKQYRLGYFDGKFQVKKLGGIKYTWEEMAFAMCSAEKREIMVGSELTDKAFKNQSEMMDAEEGSR